MPSVKKKTAKQLRSQRKKYVSREKCQLVYGGKGTKSNKKKTGKLCQHPSVINGHFCSFHYKAAKNAHQQQFAPLLVAIMTHPRIGILYLEALCRWNVASLST